jgi:hypothetical protein
MGSILSGAEAASLVRSLPGVDAVGLEARAAGLRVVTGRVMGARGYFAHDFDAPGWQSYAPYRYVQLPAALRDLLDGGPRCQQGDDR